MALCNFGVEMAPFLLYLDGKVWDPQWEGRQVELPCFYHDRLQGVEGVPNVGVGWKGELGGRDALA